MNLRIQGKDSTVQETVDQKSTSGVNGDGLETSSPCRWNQEVMNLFSQNSSLLPSDIKIPEMPKIYRRSHQNDEEIRKKEREILMKQLEKFDDNVKHAILLSKDRALKSDFYRKLESLAQTIHIYRNIFFTRSPSFAEPVKAASKERSKIGSKSPSKRTRFRNGQKKLPVIKHGPLYSDSISTESTKSRSVNSQYKDLINDRFDKIVNEVIKEERNSPERKRHSIKKMYKTSSCESSSNFLSKVEAQPGKFPNLVSPFRLQNNNEKLPNLGCNNTINPRSSKSKKVSPEKMENRALRLRRAASIKNLQEHEQARIIYNHGCDSGRSNRGSLKKLDNARIKRLAQPRKSHNVINPPPQNSHPQGDHDLSRSRLLALRNSKSLKKLKYKDEFLSAIKDLTTDISESPIKRKIPGFKPALSLKKSMIIYQSGIIEDDENKRQRRKKFQIPQKQKIISTVDSRNNKTKDTE
ncbi:unnamed protein product [Moneuplotes crassus]|uniref:Uncharacterized protein n=1 Tax=Euplotes crassus TaxID=5936 RepID=A0AAD1YBK7_EUPCR|nr:unnamed protein product [Moneuplotes crassus]